MSEIQAYRAGGLFWCFVKLSLDTTNTSDTHLQTFVQRKGSDANFQISPIGEWVKKNPPQSNLGEEGTAVVLFCVK